MNDYEKDYSRYFGSLPMPGPIVGKLANSLMYWPLMIGKRIIGVLTVQSYQKKQLCRYDWSTCFYNKSSR